MSVQRGFSERIRQGVTRSASLRITLKVVAIIAVLSLGSGLVFELLGHQLVAGMAVALGAYLVLCSFLFITLPLIALDVFFD